MSLVTYKMLLKLVVFSFCVLSCTCFPHIRFFGNVLGKTLRQNTFLGTQKVIQKPANNLFENQASFIFPPVCWNFSELYRSEVANNSINRKIIFQTSVKNNEYIIKGIEQVDLTQHQARVEFIEGGIGSKNAIVQVTAPHGTELKSAFHFFGQKVSDFFHTSGNEEVPTSN